MKFFAFLVVAVLIAGAIYHAEVTDYIADLSNGSYGSGGGSSLVGSVRSVGNASSAAFGRVGNSFGH
jgi:hypothetical protein